MKGKLSWRYIYLVFSGMSANSRCPRVGNPSRNMLKPQLAVNGAEAVMNLVLPAKRRCPHMGCGLKWNKEERSWDCPCHGSRFGEDGECLDGPAMGDLRKTKTDL